MNVIERVRLHGTVSVCTTSCDIAKAMHCRATDNAPTYRKGIHEIKNDHNPLFGCIIHIDRHYLKTRSEAD